MHSGVIAAARYDRGQRSRGENDLRACQATARVQRSRRISQYHRGRVRQTKTEIEATQRMEPRSFNQKRRRSSGRKPPAVTQTVEAAVEGQALRQVRRPSSTRESACDP